MGYLKGQLLFENGMERKRELSVQSRDRLN
jgi:hypothetical protein